MPTPNKKMSTSQIRYSPQNVVTFRLFDNNAKIWYNTYSLISSYNIIVRIINQFLY